MQMAIPDSYWRERAAEYLIEMDGIAGDESNINWQYLSTEVEAARCDTMVNGRRYVVDILRGIKPRYLQNLNERVLPRLEDLLYQIQDEVNEWFRDEESLQDMLEDEPSIAGWIRYRQRNGMKPC